MHGHMDNTEYAAALYFVNTLVKGGGFAECRP